MTLVTIVYIVLLLIFLLTSGIVIRHTLRYGYLAPTFKIVLGVFLVIATVLVVLSVYFLTTAGNTNPNTPSLKRSIPSVPSSNNSDFNF